MKTVKIKRRDGVQFNWSNPFTFVATNDYKVFDKTVINTGYNFALPNNCFIGAVSLVEGVEVEVRLYDDELSLVLTCEETGKTVEIKEKTEITEIGFYKMLLDDVRFVDTTDGNMKVVGQPVKIKEN